MNQQGNGEQIHTIVSNTEQRTLLPCREDTFRCSVLGPDNSDAETELLLEGLAALIVEAYLYINKQSKK
ncbi:hypothetical protein [Mucilaginibacter sp.]|uniref:hypothetical protein n=1 Tax=Mucilaginibacter sp. TaxID=1882438 RepID=UPI003265B772